MGAIQPLVLVAALGLVPHVPVITDEADVIELNHFFDPQGSLVFEQLIFWEWHRRDDQFHVFAWRLFKSSAQVPMRDWRRGGYVTRWLDQDILRQVHAPVVRETWTQYDPELADREFVPQNLRRGLTGERKQTPEFPVPNTPPWP